MPIVSVAKGDTLRVYVYLDQASASFVRAGDVATITRARAARLVAPGEGRPAPRGALSPKTRTMQTEVDIENDDRAILPGSYVDVELDVKVPPLLEIPAEALVMRGDKTAGRGRRRRATASTTARWWSPTTTARRCAW